MELLNPKNDVVFQKLFGRGEDYDSLNKTITINLINFNLFESEKFHNYYHLYEDESKKMLTDIMEIHFIEMKKIININKEKNNKLYRWLSFINNPNGEELITVRKNINKCGHTWQYVDMGDDNYEYI